MFDGEAFDYLAEADLIPPTDEPLAIGYERDEAVAQESRLTLCSFNNVAASRVTFSSFGDADGDRRDLLRIQRLLTADPGALARLGLSDAAQSFVRRTPWREVLLRCESVVHGGRDAEAVRLLHECRYTDPDGAVTVPVIPADAAAGLAPVVMDALLPTIVAGYADLAAAHARTGHRGDEWALKAYGNEWWHQLFGRMNAHLVETGVVAQPVRHPGEGRFLTCIRSH